MPAVELRKVALLEPALDANYQAVKAQAFAWEQASGG